MRNKRIHCANKNVSLVFVLYVVAIAQDAIASALGEIISKLN